MFSIGEFARLGGVSVRTLRHYDELGLLRPATVDPDTGYRGYSAARLGQISRIIALKELGLSLARVRRLLDGVTLGELRGMLLLRRAQFEHEVDQHTNQLLGVEARLSSIAKEDGMPDDIVAKTIPFDQLGIHDRVKEAGPRIIFLRTRAWRGRHCLPGPASDRTASPTPRARPVPCPAGSRGGRRSAQGPGSEHLPDGLPGSGPVDRGAWLPLLRPGPLSVWVHDQETARTLARRYSRSSCHSPALQPPMRTQRRPTTYPTARRPPRPLARRPPRAGIHDA